MAQKTYRSRATVWHIYLVTCSVNGRQYVGQTSVNAYARWGWTVSAAISGRKKTPLLTAIREHGPESFTIEIIERCVSQQDADRRERELIRQHGTLMPAGYNVTAGQGALGVQLSEDQKRSRSEISKAAWADPISRAKRLKGLKESRPVQAAKMRARFQSDKKLRDANRAQLKAALLRRGTGPGARTFRTIRDNKQPELF